MSTRPTPIIATDLTREGNGLRLLGATILADLASEAAERLLELNDVEARLASRINRLHEEIDALLPPVSVSPHELAVLADQWASGRIAKKSSDT